MRYISKLFIFSRLQLYRYSLYYPVIFDSQCFLLVFPSNILSATLFVVLLVLSGVQ